MLLAAAHGTNQPNVAGRKGVLSASLVGFMPASGTGQLQLLLLASSALLASSPGSNDADEPFLLIPENSNCTAGAAVAAAAWHWIDGSCIGLLVVAVASAVVLLAHRPAARADGEKF